MANNTAVIALSVTGGLLILTISGYFIYKSSQERAAAQAAADARQRQIDEDARFQQQMMLQNMMKNSGYQTPATSGNSKDATTAALITAGASVLSSFFTPKQRQDAVWNPVSTNPDLASWELQNGMADY
jgi:ribosomal protein S11